MGSVCACGVTHIGNCENSPGGADRVRGPLSVSPEKAVVLCVDEKSGMQALDRSQPVLPMMPGTPQRRSHDYARHGVTSLFAAFDIADGTVIGALHPRHRAVEFKKIPGLPSTRPCPPTWTCT